MRKIIQTKAVALTYGISDSSTTIQLKNLLKLDGSPMSASDIGDLLTGTFGPGTSREEIFSIDAANVTVESDGKVSITDIVRGLKEVEPYGTGGYSCDHPAGEIVVFGNNPQLYEYYKDYIDSIALTGGVPATDSVPGIGIVATQAQVDARATTEDYNGQAYDLFVRPDTLGNPRTVTITSYAAPTVNTDLYDNVNITAQAEAITSMTSNLSGTPKNFQKLIYRIKDNGTARAITWGASFEAKGVGLPTTTTAGKVTTIGLIYDTVTSKWGCVAVATEA